MVRLFFQEFVNGIIVNIIITVLSVIATFLVAIILGSFMGPVPPMIVCIIGGIVVGFLGAREIADDENFFVTKSKMKFWKPATKSKIKIARQLIEKKKKVKFWNVFFVLLPFVAVSAVYMFFAIKMFAVSANVVLAHGNDLNGLIVCVLNVVLFNSAIFWFLYYCIQEYYFFSCRCQCGCIMSYVEVNSYGYKSWDSEVKKTKDTYGTVGIYVDEDGNKVGEKIGRTGTSTYSTKYHLTGHTAVCKCVFCGAEKEIAVKDSMTRKYE